MPRPSVLIRPIKVALSVLQRRMTPSSWTMAAKRKLGEIATAFGNGWRISVVPPCTPDALVPGPTQRRPRRCQLPHLLPDSTAAITIAGRPMSSRRAPLPGLNRAVVLFEKATATVPSLEKATPFESGTGIGPAIFLSEAGAHDCGADLSGQSLRPERQAEIEAKWPDATACSCFAVWPRRNQTDRSLARIAIHLSDSNLAASQLRAQSGRE